MSAIDEYLQQILDAVYGEEVRGAIHDAIWQVYEDGQAGVPMSRTINGKPLSSDITLSASDVGAVPTTRTVNNKALSSDITLSASDVGAVPTARTVNNKALSSDITLSASDVGAVPTTLTVNSKPLSSNITLSASDVGAVNKTGDTMTGQLNTPGINSYASSWPGYGFALSSDPTNVLVSLNYDQNANKFTFVSGSNDGTGSTEAFSLPKPTATDGNWHNYDILTTRAYTTRTVNQSSGTAAGLVNGAGIFLVTVRDGGDDSHYWCGIIFHANNSSNPVATTIAQTSGFGFSWGNTVGTCVFSGATGNYQIKAVLLSKLD